MPHATWRGNVPRPRNYQYCLEAPATGSRHTCRPLWSSLALVIDVVIHIWHDLPSSTPHDRSPPARWRSQRPRGEKSSWRSVGREKLRSATLIDGVSSWQRGGERCSVTVMCALFWLAMKNQRTFGDDEADESNMSFLGQQFPRFARKLAPPKTGESPPSQLL